MRDSRFPKEFEAKFALWKNNLLDMSHKNKMLYFKPTSRTFLEIIAPPLEELFDRLVVHGKKFEFPPIFEPETIAKRINEEEGEYRERLGNMHRSAIEEKIGNLGENELVTPLTNKALEKLLKRLRRKAAESISELGVNTLFITFGLLKWYDIDDPKHKEPVYSPILMVPIRLYRKRILDHFHIEILDDDVTVNPSLMEKFRTTFNIELPEFPEEFDTSTVGQHLDRIRKIISHIKGWDISKRVFIGLFSYEKIRMYRDLVEYKDHLYANPIIRAIAEGGGYKEAPGNIPDPEEYSDEAEPQESYHIMDCDSSQFKAITYAKKGASMVIRGPPGTGKSQVISNIIAECLAAGKKVLFVAEKRAALDVVKKRLDKCGIGEFCLELHSQKANKAEVLKELNKSLMTELRPRNYRKSVYRNLRKQRLRLNEYIKAIHTVIGDKSSGATIYEKVGEFRTYKDVPFVKANIRRPLEIGEDKIYEIEDILNKLEIHKSVLMDYGINPWKDVKFPYYDETLPDTVREALENIADYIPRILTVLRAVAYKYNFRNVNTPEDIEEIRKFFGVYNENVLTIDPAAAEKSKSFIKTWSSEFKHIKNLIKKSLKNKKDKKDISDHLAVIVAFKRKYLKEPYKSEYRGLEEELTPLFEWGNLISSSVDVVRPILDSEGFFTGTPPEEYWERLLAIAEEWIPKTDEFEDWCAVQIAIKQLRKYGVEDFIFRLIDQPVLDLNIPLFDIFKKSFLYAWIKAAMSKFPALASFSTDYQNKILSRFLELDDYCMKLNRYRLAELLFDKRPGNLSTKLGIKSSEYNILLREMVKKRNIKPLRTILSLTKSFVTAIKPCFMMSPLSVSKYLSPEDFTGYFDVVIFDEASQICPEDAVGAILRGRQLIVVGDEKQLPPTRFFSSSPDESIDNYFGEMDVFDSILEECIGIGLPVVMLNYHYRSKKEGLITFSNFHFYESNLNTFPDTLRQGGGEIDSENIIKLPAVEFHKVDGIYDKGHTRKNKIEAAEVAKYIVEHYKRNKRNGTKFSLGVIAFSEAQQEAIINELEKLYKKDPDLEILINSYDEEPLFIKNLENVQGDERDFIFFSVGYGKDKDGNMTLNFGPLNKNGGERRLNVAITRARYHVKVFCSFYPSELNVSRTQSMGVKLLYEYLNYAYTGRFGGVTSDRALDKILPPGPLEESIAEALEEVGYKVDKKVGSSRFQIDLAVVHPEDPSRYILAVECDGGSYAATPSARDRDRIRKEVLRALGWEVFHVWTPDWFENPEKVLKKIDSIIKKRIKEEKEEEERRKNRKTEETEGEETSDKKEESPEYTVKTDESIGEKIKEGGQPDLRTGFLKLEGVRPYKIYDGVSVRTPEAFKRKQSRIKAIREILAVEGPIHWELLVKRIRDYFGLKRMTKEQKELIDEDLDDFPSDGEFIYPENMPDNLVRIMPEGKDPRKFHQIPDLELKNAMILIVKEAISIDKSELFKKTLNLFGVGGKRERYYGRLEKLLESAIKEGKIDSNAIRDK